MITDEVLLDQVKTRDDADLLIAQTDLKQEFTDAETLWAYVQGRRSGRLRNFGGGVVRGEDACPEEFRKSQAARLATK